MSSDACCKNCESGTRQLHFRADFGFPQPRNGESETRLTTSSLKPEILNLEFSTCTADEPKRAFLIPFEPQEKRLFRYQKGSKGIIRYQKGSKGIIEPLRLPQAAPSRLTRVVLTIEFKSGASWQVSRPGTRTRAASQRVVRH
jgi:hypothetical protein